MAFDVNNASLNELAAEFDRLANGRTDVFDEFKTARTALEGKLTEFQGIYGKIEVIDTITQELYGDAPATDGSPGDNPFSTDALDVLDDVFAGVGALTGLGSFIKLGLDIRRANAVQAAHAADAAADVAGQGVVAWPKLKLLGGLAGVAVSALGIALMVRDAQERTTFYQTNIPIYEQWYADLRAKIAEFETATGKLEQDLVNLQTELGYNSRAEMKTELGRTVGDVAEFRAQYVAMTKMLCNGLSTTDVQNYTGFPEALVTRRAQEIIADSSICTGLV